MRRRFWIFALILLLLGGIGRGYYVLTEGFMSCKVLYQHRPDPQLDVALSQTQKEEMEKVLCQQFFYLSKGSQCFAFQSEDGKYVLKIAKQYRFWPREWWRCLPLPHAFEAYRERKIKRSARKRDNLLKSYSIAFEKNPEDHALVAIYLSADGNIPYIVTVRDKLGLKHHLQLGKTVFVLQKKVELAGERIERQMREKNLEGAKQSVAALMQLIEAQCRLGVKDDDHRKFLLNFGFVDDQAVAIDIGRYRSDPSLSDPENCAREVEWMTSHFQDWLEERYPELQIKNKI